MAKRNRLLKRPAAKLVIFKTITQFAESEIVTVNKE
jgi:hypothetical protein